MTTPVTFFYVPGTGESYKDDERTEIDQNSLGWLIKQGFAPDTINSQWIGYDSTYGPAGGQNGAIGGESYYESKAIAKAKLLAKAKATPGWLIFGGYSQGSAAVWEVMQEVYQGKHPDLWPRILCALNVANPMRTKGFGGRQVTFIYPDQSKAINGWGVANRLGTGIEPRLWEFNLVHPEDVICNAKENAIVRDVADMTEYFELNPSANWAGKVINHLVNADWVGNAAQWVNVIEQVSRIVDLVKDIDGFISSGKHTSYRDLEDFPYLTPNGATVTMAEYLGHYVSESLPWLIMDAQDRGPNPPLFGYEEFGVVQSGWPNFDGGNLTQARVYGNRAGIIGTGTGVNVDTYGIHKTIMPADDFSITVKLGDVLQGTLDTGSSPSAFSIRIRSEAVWHQGTAVQARIQGNGVVSLSTMNGTTATERATGNGTVSVGHDITVSAVGNVYSIKNETTGVVLCSWTDTTGIAAVGPNNRRGGMRQRSNKPLLQTQWSSFTADSFRLTDLSV